jgi:NAD(P)-dependent dehydrogenase (short-subunit alcohol dehydrogenase family)
LPILFRIPRLPDAEDPGPTPALLQERSRATPPALAEVANVAAFVASDRASAMTGTIANVSGGSILD